jgi:hypothetical protein
VNADTLIETQNLQQALELILKIYQYADERTFADTASMTVFEVIDAIALERDQLAAALKRAVDENVSLYQQLAQMRADMQRVAMEYSPTIPQPHKRRFLQEIEAILEKSKAA